MNWMIYGANGYTGRLTAEEARRRGFRPVLAGRNPAAIRELADGLGLEHRVFDLEDAAALNAGVEGMALVLHCAGPFSATSRPMVDACLRAGAHYLDITGEISVFAEAHRRDEEARRADVVLMPGAGFDVVPSDCLAAKLVESLPAATRLRLAFDAAGGPSPGTAKTAAESFGDGGCIRRDGELKTVPLAWQARSVPFAHGERMAVSIPWGDVYTAFVSTGVPNIEVYMSMPPSMIRRMRRLRWIRPVLRTGLVKSMIRAYIERSVAGPSARRRSDTHSELWGEASTEDGRAVSATMSTPNGYDLTVSAALGIAGFLLENPMEGGFYTPSLLMGSDYAESLPGVAFRFSG
jgi:short subunit dehydrogenase-like uncharacterized protein